MANRRSKPTPDDRARRCLAAADVIWERCQQGAEYVYGDNIVNGVRITTAKRREACRLLMRLLHAGWKLIDLAERNDPEQTSTWKAHWRKYRDGLGWQFPETRTDAARADMQKITQLALGSED